VLEPRRPQGSSVLARRQAKCALEQASQVLGTKAQPRGNRSERDVGVIALQVLAGLLDVVRAGVAG